MLQEKLYLAVCDDEPEDIAQLCEALQDIFQRPEYRTGCVLRRFTNGTALYEATIKEHFDLIFLDIEMPDLDGFQLAEKLYLTAPESHLVFVSCHEDFVFDTFEYAPLAFVRKSALKRDLTRALYQYFQRVSHIQVSIRLKDGYGDKELFIKDILYIECEGHHLTYVTIKGLSLKAYGTLKGVEKELAGFDFLRVHKSYLVNQRYVEFVGKREVLLTGGGRVDIGKDRRKEVQTAMLQYERKRGKNGN